MHRDELLKAAKSTFESVGQRLGKSIQSIGKAAKKAGQEFSRDVKGIVVRCEKFIEKKRESDEERYSDGIIIKGTPDFRKKGRAALDQLNGSKTGIELIKGPADAHKTVTIVETGDENGYCRVKDSSAARVPGQGSDSTVSWNPSHKTVAPGDSPGAVVILGHEMVHAYHNAKGTNANGPYDSYPGQNGSSARGEERAT